MKAYIEIRMNLDRTMVLFIVHLNPERPTDPCVVCGSLMQALTYI